MCKNNTLLYCAWLLSIFVACSSTEYLQFVDVKKIPVMVQSFREEGLFGHGKWEVGFCVDHVAEDGLHAASFWKQHDTVVSDI